MQVGGKHYLKSTMQPWDVADEWDLDRYEMSVLKYLFRHKYKNRVEDLQKARHCLDRMIENYDAYYS